jgi:indolepyruvate ferredoxin oxidoreductase beta subunit
MNCILAGVGGQGTVLASKLIAQSLMALGHKVRTAETIGMAQRGGCVVSHVRAGADCASPMVPLHGADVLIGFEPAEAVRCLPYLKAGGTAVVSRRAVRPVTASLTGSSYDGSEMIAYLKENVPGLILIDADAVCAAAGSPKALNVALVGAALRALSIPKDVMCQTIQSAVRPQFAEINRRALNAGLDAARKEEPLQ